MLVEEVLKQINESLQKANPTRDFSREITLTGSAIALPNEACKQVTIFNTLTSSVVITLNSGSNITIPSNFGGTFAVNNTNEITVNGTSTAVLTYIVGQ